MTSKLLTCWNSEVCILSFRQDSYWREIGRLTNWLVRWFLTRRWTEQKLLCNGFWSLGSWAALLSWLALIWSYMTKARVTGVTWISSMGLSASSRLTWRCFSSWPWQRTRVQTKMYKLLLIWHLLSSHRPKQDTWLSWASRVKKMDSTSWKENYKVTWKDTERSEEFGPQVLLVYHIWIQILALFAKWPQARHLKISIKITYLL